MKLEYINHGQTCIRRTMPWGLNTRSGHRLLCSDGQIRAAELAETPDTFFSTPAKMRINKKWISGYMTMEEAPWKGGDDKPARVFSFRQHTEQKNPHSLPAWDQLTPEDLTRIIDAAGGTYECKAA